MTNAPRPTVAYLRPPDPAHLDPGAVPPELDVVAIVAECSAERTRLGQALESIASGQAGALFALKLSSLAGSLSELLALLDWLDAAGADLITLDPELDTGRRGGRRAVALLREIDRWGRQSERPRGRPSLSAAAPGLAERIAALREEGLSLHSIAARLEADGVPTPRGGARWRASSVQSALGYRRPRPPAPGAPPPRPPGPGGPRGGPRHGGPPGPKITGPDAKLRRDSTPSGQPKPRKPRPSP